MSVHETSVIDARERVAGRKHAIDVADNLVTAHPAFVIAFCRELISRMPDSVARNPADLDSLRVLRSSTQGGE